MALKKETNAPHRTKGLVRATDDDECSESDRLLWLKDARFGVFFHWGTYAVHAHGSWAMHQEAIPAETYRQLAYRFKPRKGWADEWMDLVVGSGARYAVLTTKHHEGYCLFPTKTTDYNAAQTGPGRDLIREYVDACRRAKVKVGFYYSAPDWRFGLDPITPDSGDLYSRYKDSTRAQVEELCTNYGPIDLWWWDGEPPDVDETLRWMREAQPKMVINDRCGRELDCASCEKEIRPPADIKRPWECCTTSNEHWGYFGPGDIKWLRDVDAIHWLVTCASWEGNLLLNIGPKADGTLPAKAVSHFTRIGEWLEVNGESIYGTRRSSLSGGAGGATTARGEAAYLHILHYLAPEYVILSPRVRVLSARVLSTGQELNVRQEGERVIISGLPRRAPDRRDTVVVLKTDGCAEA